MEMKAKILKEFATFVKKNRHIPTFTELMKMGITKAKVKHHFGNKIELKKEAQETYPEAFKDFIDYDSFNDSTLKQLKKKIRGKKRFVISSVLESPAPVFEPFLKSIQNYCKVNNAELLLFSSDSKYGNIDPIVPQESIIFGDDDIKLNNNLFLSTIKLSPKQIDPSTGLIRLARNNGSFIFGSPKQRLVYKPTGMNNNKIPTCLMTTGSISKPHYEGKKYIQKRTDKLAELDHIVGAVVVEIEDNNHFHFRQIQSDNSGGFFDVDKYYLKDKVTSKNASALVLGDWHSGETSPIVREATYELQKQIKADHAVIHDGFDGKSINHHEANNIVQKSIRAKNNELSLEDELINYANDLNELCEHFKDVVLVKSNHDDFLNRYLQNGTYIADPQNHYISLTLAKWLIEGKDPLQEYITPLLKKPKNVIWLELDEEFYIEDVLVSEHGHIGANGSRGSISNIEKTTFKATIGHSHTPQILRQIFQVGTSTGLRQSYNKGASSWANTHNIIYQGGSRTLINIIKGKFRI